MTDYYQPQVYDAAQQAAKHLLLAPLMHSYTASLLATAMVHSNGAGTKHADAILIFSQHAELHSLSYVKARQSKLAGANALQTPHVTGQQLLLCRDGW